MFAVQPGSTNFEKFCSIFNLGVKITAVVMKKKLIILKHIISHV
jgi:hypothetical protein